MVQTFPPTCICMSITSLRIGYSIRAQYYSRGKPLHASLRKRSKSDCCLLTREIKDVKPTTLKNFNEFHDFKCLPFCLFVTFTHHHNKLNKNKITMNCCQNQFYIVDLIPYHCRNERLVDN